MIAQARSMALKCRAWSLGLYRDSQNRRNQQHYGDYPQHEHIIQELMRVLMGREEWNTKLPLVDLSKSVLLHSVSS